MTTERWTRLEWTPPADDDEDHEVLVNGEPWKPSEAELQARHRDEKWKRRGYRR